MRVADSSTALHLYRIAQEAVNNAIKHARASRIGIEIGIRDGRGYLSVEDDGIGFGRSIEKIEGLGLRIMKHRCSLIDADCKFESSHAEGTRIKWYFAVEQ